MEPSIRFPSRNIKYMVTACWLTSIPISLLSMLTFSKELGPGTVLDLVWGWSLLEAPFLKRIFIKRNGKERKIFRSPVGYIVCGICMGLYVLAISFNLIYVGGWFDFTDVLFWFFSFPLIEFVKFNFDNQELASRVSLWALCFLNLALITAALDYLAYFITWLVKKIMLNLRAS